MDNAAEYPFYSCRVKRVDDGVLTVQRNGKEELMPFGTCVWATGVAMHPLVSGRRLSSCNVLSWHGEFSFRVPL